MNAGYQDYGPIARSMVIHPALSEVVARAFANLMPPKEDIVK
jgi:dihydrolipoamide dehydrogenase